jgi:DNA-binding IclR family transcriptional regulator
VVRKTGAQRVEAVDRALHLLTLLSERGTVQVSDAAKELGVSVSTAHRLFGTLRARGFARQTPDRAYALGPAIRTELANVYATMAGILHPAMEECHQAAGETIHSMIPVGGEIRVIDGLEREGPPRPSLRVGAHAPAFVTAGGLDILAAMDPDRVRLLYAGGLPRWPHAPIIGAGQLADTVAQTRARGHAIVFQTFEPGIVSIGKAVRAPDGEPVGAYALSVAVERYSRRAIGRAVPWLIEAGTMAEAMFAAAIADPQSQAANLTRAGGW